jgi:hypothetical protein
MGARILKLVFMTTNPELSVFQVPRTITPYLPISRYWLIPSMRFLYLQRNYIFICISINVEIVSKLLLWAVGVGYVQYLLPFERKKVGKP